MNNYLLDLMIFMKEIKNKNNLEFKNFKITDYSFSKNNKILSLELDDNNEIEVDISNINKNINVHLIDKYMDKELEYKEIDSNLKELKSIVEEVFTQINEKINDMFLNSIKKKEIINEVIKNVKKIKEENKNITIDREVIYKLLLQATIALNKENVDDLTKLYNGRFFKFLSEGHREEDKKLKEELLSKTKTGKNDDLYLLFMDLNNFKTINDEYGHDIGDKVLVTFADKLKETVKRNGRNKGIVIRKSGDEFLAICNKALARKVIKNITSKEFINELNKPVNSKNPVTSASFGFSKIIQDNIKEATIDADRKLNEISKPVFHYLLDNNTKIRHKKVSKEEYKKALKEFKNDLKKEFGIKSLVIYNNELNINSKTPEV